MASSKFLAAMALLPRALSSRMVYQSQTTADQFVSAMEEENVRVEDGDEMVRQLSADSVKRASFSADRSCLLGYLLFR
ncbi:hypothetical protein VTK73DRAFT_4725 [Phialemonium thermophilum]|uniref:Uncharacterized protein n=1 Tax=Phialemonium thermophilum TaxID=223376 RepID=A0ABR3V6U6_9PEZI